MPSRGTLLSVSICGSISILGRPLFAYPSVRMCARVFFGVVHVWWCVRFGGRGDLGSWPIFVARASGNALLGHLRRVSIVVLVLNAGLAHSGVRERDHDKKMCLPMSCWFLRAPVMTVEFLALSSYTFVFSTYGHKSSLNLPTPVHVITQQTCVGHGHTRPPCPNILGYFSFVWYANTSVLFNILL